MTAVTDLIAQMRQYEYSGNVQTLMAKVESFIAALLELETGGDITLAGDVTGLANANTVVKWQNNAVKAGVPTADGQFYEWNATNTDFELVGPGTLLNVQVFNASGTYTPTPGTHSALVDSVAGGGGSGGCTTGSAGVNANASGGGGPGNFLRFFMNGANIAVHNIVIGAGGTAGANTGTNGGAGGNTTIDVSTGITLVGGNGGGGSNAATATQKYIAGAPVGSGSTIPATSANFIPLMTITSGGGDAGAVINGVSGAILPGAGFGGEIARTPVRPPNGDTGAVAGGSGGGGATGAGSTTTAQTGGIGGGGLVIIYEFA